jgi:hypothetical protein
MSSRGGLQGERCDPTCASSLSQEQHSEACCLRHSARRVLPSLVGNPSAAMTGRSRRRPSSPRRADAGSAPSRGVPLRERLVARQRRRRDSDFQQRDQLTPTRLCFNARGHDRLASIRDHHDITRLDVRRRVFQGTEVVAGCVVETVDRHRASSIDRLSARCHRSRPERKAVHSVRETHRSGLTRLGPVSQVLLLAATGLEAGLRIRVLARSAVWSCCCDRCEECAQSHRGKKRDDRLLRPAHGPPPLERRYGDSSTSS